jgi:hypothetical protein
LRRSTDKLAPLLVLAIACAEPEVSEPAPLGSALRTGMQLIYASGESEQPPWVVESLEQPALIAGLTHCVRVALRMAPAPSAAQPRAWCVQDWKLQSFNDSTLEFQPLRPVGPGMLLELPRPDGGRIRYETGTLERDTVGDIVLDVVPTSVTTLDAQGQPVRRLRERYAMAITSATRGTFEVPDSLQPGQWRPTQEFRLVALRTPPP